MFDQEVIFVDVSVLEFGKEDALYVILPYGAFCDQYVRVTPVQGVCVRAPYMSFSYNSRVILSESAKTSYGHPLANMAVLALTGFIGFQTFKLFFQF